MKRFSFGSLRVRLIILVLLATIPALGITLYTGLEQHQIAADKAKNDAQSLAHFVSNRQKQFIEGAHQFLHILAQLPQVRSYDTAACSRLFNDLLNQYPHYLNIGAIGLDGYIFASAIPLKKPIYVADRPYFQRVLKTRKFTVGVYQIGRITGKPGVNLGYPVMDDIGKVKAVVYVVLDLTWLNQLTLQVDLPQDSILSLIDSDSTILARYPEPEKWVGKTMPEASVVKTILAKGEGMIETIGADGVKRLYAFTSFGSTENQADKIYLSIGIPSSAVFVQVNRILIRNLAFLLFISLLALSAAWFGGNLLVLRQLNPIVSTAKRLGAGDLSARTGIVYGKGELSQLAFTFDEMAESLEKHEAERKKAEEALKESEEKYRLVVENAGDAILIAQGGMIQFVNSKATEILGYSYDEFISRPFVEFIHPEDRMTVLEYHLKRIKGKGLPGIYSFRVVDKDGNTKWVEINAVSITWHEKPATLNFLRDVTERQRVEEALRESEDRYRDLVEHSHDLLCTHDLEGKLLSVNPAALRISGYSKDGLLGMNFRDFLAPEFRDQFVNYLTEIQAKGAASGVMLVQTKGGEKRLWEYHNTLRTEGVVAPIVRGMARDITERQRVEEALRESENRFRQIVENTEEWIWEVDPEGLYTYASPVVEKILGYKPEEVVERMHFYDLFSPEVREELKKAAFGVFARKENFKEFVNPNIHKLGHRVILETSGVPILNAKGDFLGYRGADIDITDRKRAEEALRSEREKLELVTQDMGAGLAFISKDYHTLWANNVLKQIFGDVEGKPCYSTYNQKAEVCPGCGVREVFEKGSEKVVHEQVGKDSEGNTIWSEIIATPVKDKDGNIMAALELVIPITERKKAEEALRSSEEKYRTILETIEEGYYEVDLAGNFTLFNDSLCRMLGYTRDELTGMNNRQYMDKETAKKVYQVFSQLYTTGEPYKTFDWEIIRKDGTRRFHDSSVSLIRNEKGEGIGFRGIARDITERKRTEEAFRASEKRFRELFDEAPVGYHEIDKEGKIIRVNRTELDMLGYTAEEMVGRYVYEFITEEISPQSVKTKLAGELPVGATFERTYLRKDGTTIPVLLEEKLIKDNEGRIVGIRSTIQDITERKRAEEEKATLQDQLRQSQKIEAIGRLAGGIAHDFNNLLTVIKGYSQLSLIELKEDVPLRGNIEEIKRASEKAADLTRQLLAFSRRQILEMKVLDLNTVLRDMDKMLHRLIGEDIELITLFADDLGRVKTDPGWVEQIIMNLAVNARDAMPSVGKLTIETANVELDGAYARNHSSNTGSLCDAFNE